jgi:DNA-binding NarL/FixJ family response regulator
VLDGATGELLLAAVERHALVAHPEVFAMTDRPLTKREEQIAELVAKGRTNDEVAAELGLGPKTVETHLTRIYRKLGVRSRTELAARARAEVGGFT